MFIFIVRYLFNISTRFPSASTEKQWKPTEQEKLQPWIKLWKLFGKKKKSLFFLNYVLLKLKGLRFYSNNLRFTVLFVSKAIQSGKVSAGGRQTERLELTNEFQSTGGKLSSPE